MAETSFNIKDPGLNVLPPGVERYTVNGGGITGIQIFPDDEIEIGMGIHGEPGIKREKLRSANDLVDDLYKRILEDSKLKSNDNIAIMINSLGATPLEELYIVSKRLNENLSNSKIKNIRWSDKTITKRKYYIIFNIRYWPRCSGHC